MCRSKFLVPALAAMLAALALVGCNTNQQTAALSGAGLVAGSKVADDLLQSGEVEAAVFSIELSEADRDTVVAGFDDYAIAREILGDLVRSPETVLSLRATIQNEHARLVHAYRDIQRVVGETFGEYSAVDQARLKRWQSQAERLEAQYNNFLAAVDSEISADVRYERLLEVLRVVSQIALMAV